MSRPSLLGLLRQLEPGTSLERARQQLSKESAWLRLLDRENERLNEFWRHEQSLLGDPELRAVAGADEVGRGPMAGPLVAGAVSFSAPRFIPGLKDSKQLTAEERELLVPWIRRLSRSWAVWEISVETINAGNLHFLSLEAMQQAVGQLSGPVDHLLIDGRFRIPADLPQTPVIKGDRTCASIAAASILAKVHRDQLMVALDKRYPGYGFDRHKGYATAEHFEALERLGASPIHRRTFAPVRMALQGTLFETSNPS